jgi:hypothetical protein
VVTADLVQQGERLVELGVPALAGMSLDDFRSRVAALGEGSGLLAVHPDLVPAAALTPLLERAGKPGFVVVDMDDLTDFVPIEGLGVPAEPLYVVDGLDRGDDMLNWSPAEALPAITARGRRPLTVSEGICWLLQEPERLEPNHCFMTIGSRKPKGKGLDARTPAIWISGGTGRDGTERRGAPKVGWCWHNNRHTWLGFASCEA